MVRRKKIPQRKCIITKEMRPKKELIRIVRNKDGEVFVDPTGKKNGRGAYLTVEKDIIKRAREEDILKEVFRVEVDDRIYDELEQLVSDESNE